MSWIHERVEVHRTEVTQVLRYYLKYDKQFRRLRPDKITCELCQHKFIDGEYFNLAFTSKGNKIICEACTVIAAEHGTKVTDRPKATGTTE